MKCLCIQIQPKRDLSHKTDEVILLAREIGRHPEIDSNDEKNYINLNFFTEDVSTLWNEIQSEILQHNELGSWVKEVSIIACEGENGWDDHQLLFHYDKSESLDTL